MPFVVAPEVPACPGAWLWVPGQGIGGGEDGGAVGGAPRSPPRWDLRPQTLLGCRGHQTPMPKPVRAVGVRPPQARSRALVCRGSWRRDGDHETSCPSPALLDWACKELKKYIYVCGFFGQGSESLVVFCPLHSLGITQHTVKDNICAEPCVCVCLVQVESWSL